MSEPQEDIPVPAAITIDELAQRLDVLGGQMNWLCDNMQSLFQFVNQMGSNGGGIRGLMSMLRQSPPDLNPNTSPDNTNKVGS